MQSRPAFGFPFSLHDSDSACIAREGSDEEAMSDSGKGSVTDDPQECTEEQVSAMLARSPVGANLGRWLSCGKGSIAAVRHACCLLPMLPTSECCPLSSDVRPWPRAQIKLNWVSSLMAVAILWGFAITCMVKDSAADDFAEGKSWVSQNFTWLYIGARSSHSGRSPDPVRCKMPANKSRTAPCASLRNPCATPHTGR